MTTIKSIFYAILLPTIILIAALEPSAVNGQQLTANRYQLRINYIDKDSSFTTEALKLQTYFTNQALCFDYINKLPGELNMKGYPFASVDTVLFDTTFAQVKLFLGTQHNIMQLRTDSVDKKALDYIGFVDDQFLNKPLKIQQLQFIKERLINYYEKNGYPFAEVFLNNIQLTTQTLFASLQINKGPLYHIDSIRIKGKVKISSNLMQNYLGIQPGSIYNKDKLDQVSKRLLELPYLQEAQPSELMMLGTGSILDIYLLPKKSSQVNFLIGFLPASSQNNKLRLTGDVNLNLRNALGAGETILINWQQLQVNSPRVNIAYQQPYIFKSPFGLDFAFDLFKKDSTFLQLNAQLGIQYLLSAHQSGKIFFQNQSSFLLGSGVDTNQVKATRQLPLNIDVRGVNIGLDYELNTTNYRFNPISGNEVRFLSSIGIKTINRNNEILRLKDPLFDYSTLYDSIRLRTYQVKAKITAAHYIKSGKKSTLKTIINLGLFGSQSIFRNELFQIGGYKLLRGFDEESIYATQYAVFTLEYRNLVGLNSYLFTFMDAGWVKNKHQAINIQNNFISAGLGLVFETKVGLLNMSFAIGKRNDVKFDLKQSAKIHFGYINYF